MLGPVEEEPKGGLHKLEWQIQVSLRKASALKMTKEKVTQTRIWGFPKIGVPYLGGVPLRGFYSIWGTKGVFWEYPFTFQHLSALRESSTSSRVFGHGSKPVISQSSWPSVGIGVGIGELEWQYCGSSTSSSKAEQ